MGLCLWAWLTLNWGSKSYFELFLSLLFFPIPHLFLADSLNCHKHLYQEGKTGETPICPTPLPVISVMKNSLDREEEKKLTLLAKVKFLKITHLPLLAPFINDHE